MKIPFFREGPEELEVFEKKYTKSTKRSKIGDVLEIESENTFFYLVYTHKSDFMGHILQILKYRFTAPIDDVPLLLKEFEHGEFRACISSISVLLDNGNVKKIGNIKTPKNLQIFPLFRAGIQDRDIGLWQEFSIWDGREGRGVFLKQKDYPEINVNKLPEWAAIPIQSIIEISKSFPIKDLSTH